MQTKHTLGFQRCGTALTKAGRKAADNYTPANPEQVRLASQERADKVRAPVSSYVHERNMIKYLIIKHGREEAARIVDARNAIFRR